MRSKVALPPQLQSGLFWAGAMTFIAMGVINALYGPALPALARGGGVSLAEAGVIVSLHALGGLLALIAGAVFGGLTGRMAVAAALVGAFLIAASGPWPLTMAGALMLGAGYAMTASVYNRRFLLQMGAQGPAMVGLLNAIFGIGSIGGPLILVAAGGSVQVTYGLLALALVALLPFADCGCDAAPVAPVGGSASVGAALRRPYVMTLGALGVGFEVAVVGLGPAALIARGLTEREAALTASAFFVFLLLGRLSLVWLAARIPALWMLALAILAAGACLALANLAFPATFYALSGAAIGMIFPSYFVAASARYGTQDRVASIILVAVYVGAVAIPAATALAMGRLGGGALFGVLSLLALVAAGLAMAAALRARTAPG